MLEPDKAPRDFLLRRGNLIAADDFRWYPASTSTFLVRFEVRPSQLPAFLVSTRTS